MGKTFEDLKASIHDWLIVGSESSDERLPDSVVGDIINIVQRDYLRRRESWLGEQTYVLSVSSGVSSYTAPANFSKPSKLWYINTSNEIAVLKYSEKDAFDVNYPYSALLAIPGAGALALEGGGFLELEGGGSLELSSSLASLVAADIGEPELFTLWGDKIVFGKCPSREFPLMIDFWGYRDDLQDDPNGRLNTNLFINNAWDYLLWASLVHSTEYGIEDERIVTWQAEKQRAENALDLENARRRQTARVSQSAIPGRIR